MTESLAARGEGAQEATLQVRVQAAATLAALTVALSGWCNPTAPSSRPPWSICFFAPYVAV